VYSRVILILFVTNKHFYLLKPGEVIVRN